MKKLSLLLAGAIFFIPVDASAKSAAEWCERGSLFSGKITVRSFKGVLCKVKKIAGWAESNCEGIDSYEDSGCHKNAKKALGDTDPKKYEKIDIEKELEDAEEDR